MTERVTAFVPEWISPPGETISDLLEERGWTQAEFADRTRFTTKHISLLINGKAPITEETALRLERVLGSTARFWLAREAEYRAALLRRAEQRELQHRTAWLDQLPVQDMLRFGWIKRTPTKGALVEECLRFFGVASVEAWQSRYGAQLAAFRASKKLKKDSGAVASWLRQGERVAETLGCAAFAKEEFLARLRAIRALTNESNPDVFVPALIESCAKAGVAVALVPTPRGCPVSGAAKWLTPEKALLMLSLRHKSNDHLWFSFFHEAAHLILHGKRLTFIDVEKMLGDEHESEADRFASDWLIPANVAAQLPVVATSEAAVRAFASKIGIAPGIVVGRLQKEGYAPWGTYLNRVKVRYAWAHDT